MKRHVNDKDQRIISTHDVYVGADNTSSLQDYLDQQETDISNLKKWTKWYVKYGGMGSGSGGGGGTTGGTDYKAYLETSDQSVEIKKDQDSVDLWGKGDYNFIINLLKTQGHSFEISYQLGSGPVQRKTIYEGGSSTSIQLRFTEKVNLKFSIKDTFTDEEIASQQVTVTPESYVITPSMILSSSGRAIKSGDTISINFIYDDLVANFNYVINKNLELSYVVRYQFEGSSEWIVKEKQPFPSPSGDSSISGIISVPISFDDTEIDPERDIGKVIKFELAYGMGESPAATEAGKFNLSIVPNGFFVLLKDNGTGALYPDPDQSDPVTIKKGFLPFLIDLNSDAAREPQNVSVSIYKKEGSSWISKYDETRTIPINTDIPLSSTTYYGIQLSDPGEYKIIASYSSTISSTKYFYIQESTSRWSYNRYDSYFETGRTSFHTYYQSGSQTPYLDQPIELYHNSLNKTVTNDNYQSNISFSLGYQYDKSNDDNTAFLEFTFGAEDLKLEVYQSKVVYNNTEIVPQYYLPKTKESNIGDRDLWHLLNINIFFIGEYDSFKRYEVSIYIDGELEATAYTNTITAIPYDLSSIKSISVNPDQSQIIKVNLFDLCCTSLQDNVLFSSSSRETDRYSTLYDAYASYYYNQYRSDLGFEDTVETAEFLDDILSGFSFDEYGIPYTTLSTLKNLVSKKNLEQQKILRVPVLVLEPNVPETLPDFFTHWFLASWPDTDLPQAQPDPKNIECSLSYVPKDGIDDLENYRVQYSFQISIQGSSTRSYGTKNLELSIIHSEEGKRNLFTPYFSADDPKESLLPEESFTLKADMVDSSTCNNNSIGKFINANTTPLDTDNCAARRSVVFRDYIKNCLIGIPVLVFIKYKDKYYYPGIYNFNLGRNSYFNLGYYQNSAYEAIEGITELGGDGLKVISVREDDLQLHPTLTVAEVRDGGLYYDFSQYDQSVLFAQEEGDEYPMFGESDSILNIDSNSRNKLGNAVRAIARGGGYIFDSLYKNKIKLQDVGNIKEYDAEGEEIVFSTPYNIFYVDPDTQTHISRNYVSDYRYQYRRTPKQSEYTEKSEVDSDAAVSDLIGCISVVDDEGQRLTPYIDLQSLVEYYVICMVFGMVDSVEKNLELKAWGNKTIFPAFYDMDTALGVDNAGKPIDFFAFSDFWQNKETETQESIYTVDGVTIYPDFFDAKSGYVGYDIPSSYLFAIAKYATMSLVGIDSSLPKINSFSISPINVYSLLRKSDGPLSSAENFMENYFDRLKDIPAVFRTLNYRSKYSKVSSYGMPEFDPIIKKTTTEGTSTITDRLDTLGDITKFKGNGRYKKKDWLEYRLHLLDAYFNVSSVDYRVEYATLSDDDAKIPTWGNYRTTQTLSYYTYPISSSGVIYGSDVQINSQIFGSETKSNISESVRIKAPSFTPVILQQSGSQPKSFLVGDDLDVKSYSIRVVTQGNQTWHFYGSRMFSYIDNIGKFGIGGDINSDNLKEINFLQASSRIEGITLYTPNIKSIKVNGSNYSGRLTLGSTSYNRLESIDISGNSVTIEESKSLPVTSLDISRKNSSMVSLPALYSLSSVSLDNSTIGSLSLPVWKQNLSFTGDISTSGFDYHNVKFTTLSLNNNGKKFSNISIKISNMPTLTTLNLKTSGITSIEVSGCPVLETVTIGEDLESLTINNCSSNARSLTITSSEGVENVVDLTEVTSLSSLNLYSTRKFKTVKISSQVNLPTNAFRECQELEHLDTISGGKFILKGTSTFYNCYHFTLDSSNSTESSPVFPTIEIGTGNISNTFYRNSSSTGNSIRFSAADNFLTYNYNQGKHTQVTNIDYLFYANSKIGEDWSFSKYFTNLSKYTSITTAIGAFASCGINYWSKELFNFGSSAGVVITGVFRCASVNARTNFLQNIGSKITTYNDNISNSGITYTFYGSSGSSPLTTVSLKDVFQYTPNLTTLCGFLSISNQTVDLKNCFDVANRITKISRFLYSSTNWTGMIYNDTDGFTTSCFQSLTNLKQLGGCLSSAPSGYSLDLFNLFSGQQWRSLTDIFSFDPSYTGYGSFSMTKHITLENFNTLKSYIAENNASTIHNLFKNCNITECGEIRPVLQIHSPNSSKVTTLYHWFENSKAWSGAVNSNRVPVKFTEDDTSFFYYYPNVTSCDSAFAGTWIDGCIPFNFFNRRVLKTGVGYYPDITQNPETIDKATYEYIYYVVTNGTPLGSKPTIPDGIDDELPISRQTDLVSNLNPQSMTTSGWTSSEFVLSSISNKLIRTNTKRCEIWIAKRTRPTGTSVKYGTFEVSNNPYEKFNTPIEVNYRYFKYEGQKITNVENMFNRALFTVPYFDYDDVIYSDDNRSSITDSNGESYDCYWNNRDCSSLGSDYRLSYEILDLEVGRTPGNVPVDTNITVNDQSFKNYKVLHSTGVIHPFVSPDFFYGLKTEISMAGLFRCEYTQAENYELNQNLNSYPLEGYIPEHLLMMQTGFTTANGFIENTNIFPVIEKDRGLSKNYIFVPRNFISFALSTPFNLFNFHIRVPSYNPEDGDENAMNFYIMYKDSITFSNSYSNTIGGMFPQYALHGSDSSRGGAIVFPTTGGRITVSTGNYNFHYKLIYDYDNEGEGTIDGVSGIGNAYYYDMISADLLYVASTSNGWWSDSIKMNNIKNSGKNVVTGIHTNTGGTQLGINKFFKFPEATGAFDQLNITPKVDHINSNSCNGSDSYWRDSYNNITIETG